MTDRQITVATPADQDDAVGVIALAFATDPIARWTWPDPARFLAHFPRFVKAFGGAAFTHGGAFCAGRSASALWLAPGVEPDEEALGALLEQTAPDESRQDAFALIEQMSRYHPQQPHWYLPLMGVDPLHQGEGWGSALLQAALARIDGAHQPAYLESTHPRNVPLYQRHGFELLGTIQCGSSPPMFPMLRQAR